MAAFTTEEYRERVNRVSGLMEDAGIDTLVVLDEPNICYLTGYEGRSDYVPQAAVVKAGDADATLILREMDIHCAYPTVYLHRDRVECYPESHIGTPERSPWEVIGAKILETAGGGTIGVELGASVFSFNDHKALVGALGGREMRDATDILPRVKIRKSPAEIAYMRTAGKIVDRALTNGIAEIAVGVRQCDVAARITHDLIAGLPECGGDPPFHVTMPTGPGVAQAPHLKWTDQPYRDGDQTDFEVGGFVHRYTCALSRAVYLGTPPPRLIHVHDVVRSSFEAALDAVRPGATCADVSRAFRKVFAASDLRKESRIGYSIGLNWSDLCFSLQDDDETVLEENYTMHLIIGIWEHDDAYVFSETIRVGETAGESLSTMTRDLIVV